MPRPIRLRLRALAPLAAAALVLGAPGLARAQVAAEAATDTAEPAPSDAIFVERPDAELLAVLADVDRAILAREFDAVAPRLQLLIEHALSDARDRLVDGRRPGPGGEPMLEGLEVALRERLAGLPAAGLSTYRALVDARAAALAREAISSRDEARLEDFLSRYLFSSSGERVAMLLGDLYFERGEALGAASTYALVADNLGPEAAARVASRLTAARAALTREQRARARAARIAAPARPLTGPPVRAAALAPEGREVSDETRISVPPVRIPGGIAVLSPGKLSLVRGSGEVETLPPGAEAFEAPTTSMRLQPACAGGILAASVRHARALDGDIDPGSAPGADAQPISPGALDDPGGAGLAPDYDIYAFDATRGDRIIWTTAEASRYPEERSWMATVEWTGPPEIGAGALFAGAATVGSLRDVSVAAFDAGAPGRLRWHRFLGASAFQPGDRSDSQPTVAQPGVLLAGDTLLVDTGIGLLVGIDAWRGDVRWAARCHDLRGFGGFDPPLTAAAAPPEPAPPAPPARPIAGDTPETADVAIFAPDGPGNLLALSVRSGALLWWAAGESPLEPIGFVEGRLLASAHDELALFDGRSGKRACASLPMPGPIAGDPAIFERTETAGDDAAPRLFLPVAGGVLLAVAMEEPARGSLRLVPRYTVQLGAPHAELLALPGEVVYLRADGLYALTEAATPTSTSQAASLAGLIGLYGGVNMEEASVADALGFLGRASELARAGKRPAPGAEETPAGAAFEYAWGKPGEVVVARAFLAAKPMAPRVAITVDLGGRFGFEVRPPSE